MTEVQWDDELPSVGVWPKAWISWAQLKPRELQVLQAMLVAEFHDDPAKVFSIPPGRVLSCLDQAHRRTCCQNTAALVTLAYECGWMPQGN